MASRRGSEESILSYSEAISGARTLQDFGESIEAGVHEGPVEPERDSRRFLSRNELGEQQRIALKRLLDSFIAVATLKMFMTCRQQSRSYTSCQSCRGHVHRTLRLRPGLVLRQVAHGQDMLCCPTAVGFTRMSPFTSFYQASWPMSKKARPPSHPLTGGQGPIANLVAEPGQAKR